MQMQPDHDEILKRVASIAPQLARNAAACDQARRVIPESMRAMVDAGLFRISEPARVGGYEMNLRTLGHAVIAISQACAASGWVLMVMGAHHWCLGSFPETAQDGVFGGGRDGLVAGTLSWQGTAKPVDRGYRVDGRWQFCSGVDNCDWVMLGCGDSSHAPLVHVIVRREQLEIDDNWQVLGLRGTGSKDVLAHDVFVPASDAIDTRELFRGESPHNRRHQSNVYRLSPEAMLSNSVATAVLGSASFALQQFIQRTRERKIILTGASKAEHVPTQIRLAEAASEIESAQLLIEQNFADFDQLMRSAEPAAVDARVRVKWRAAYAAELCRRAAARLYSGSGAHAVYEPSPLQAAFRNINVGAQHASIDFDSSAEQYGRLRLR